jgi:spore germination cell wall hydrolase CwlJ-like protein
MYKFFVIVVTGIVLSFFLTEKINAQQRELTCVAKAIYFEARSEPFLGQLAVANVIQNRVNSKRFPNTHCGVVYQAKKINGKIVRNKCAFSFYCDGKIEKIKDAKAYAVAQAIAKLALDNVYVDLARKATHYHATYVIPSWARKLQYLGRIGRHRFYYEKD